MSKAKTTPIPEAIAARPKSNLAASSKLSAQDIQAISDIVATAPCPGGIPQAQARSALLQRFIASQSSAAYSRDLED